MQVPLDRNAPQPLYRQIMQFLDSQITAGNLPPGSKLPPIRQLAERLGVSKTIVSMAYAEMQAAGRVEGRVGQVCLRANYNRRVEISPFSEAEQRRNGVATGHETSTMGNRDAAFVHSGDPEDNSLAGRDFVCRRAPGARTLPRA